MIEDHEEVTIGILVTMKCNFECQHCMYSCGPHGKAQYMSNDTLWKIKKQVIELQDQEYPVRINIIGGEPTLNFVHFKRVLDTVMDWEVPVEMTTNGWWLHKHSTLKKFLKIVAPYSGDPDQFTIRVSNDQFHREQRPYWLNYNQRSVKNYLDELFNEGALYYDVYHEDDHNIPCIEPINENAPWLYVDNWEARAENICPQGRGASIGFQDGSRGYGGRGKRCPWVGDNLCYRPNGVLMDICCRGSDFPAGTVDDNPIVLLRKARWFVDEVQPECFNCRVQAALWLKERKHAIPGLY